MPLKGKGKGKERWQQKIPASSEGAEGRASLNVDPLEEEEAVTTLKKALSDNPNYFIAHLVLTIVYSELGQKERAQSEATEILRLSPTYSLEVHGQRLPFKDPAVLERFLAGLRQAGLK